MERRIVCALALLLVATLAGAAAAPAAKPPPPKPGQLWSKFPLGTQQLSGTAPTIPTPTTKSRGPSRPGPRPASTEPSPPKAPFLPDVPLFVLIAAVLGLGVEALIVLRRHPRENGSPEAEEIRTSLATIKEAAARLERRRVARRVEARRFKWHNFSLSRKRGKHMSDQLSEGVEGEAGAAPRVDHVDLGDRVSGVIRAAEELAAQIRADAVEDAGMIKKEAEDAAVKAIRQAAKERDELRAASEAKAEAMRIDSESYASGLRSDAEAEVARALAEGEAQARALREAAEEMARKIEARALRRREEIEEGSRGAESQLRRFQLGLASISEHLEGLLEPRAERPETLTEALAVNGGQKPRT